MALGNKVTIGATTASSFSAAYIHTVQTEEGAFGASYIHGIETDGPRLGSPVVVGSNITNSAFGAPFFHSVEEIGDRLGNPVVVGANITNSAFGAPYIHGIETQESLRLGAPVVVGANIADSAFGAPYFDSVDIIPDINQGVPVVVGTNTNTSFAAPFSFTLDFLPVDPFKPLRRADNRAHKRELAETEIAILAHIERETSGTASLYGGQFDSVTTQVSLGTGSAVTDVFIGRSGQDVNIQGNFQTTGELLLKSDNILLSKGVTTAVDAAFVTERGSSNLDAMILWEEGNDRAEFGLSETTGGTVIPGSITTFVDLKIDNLLLAGTAITADGALTVTATGSTSDLTFGSRSTTIALSDASNTSLSGYSATSIFGAFAELQTTPTPPPIVLNTYTNDEGSTINQGELVYLSGVDNIKLAVATSNNAPSIILGIVQDTTILNAASGSIVSKGVVSVKFEASLTLSGGDEIFISSTTSGRATNIRPSGSGNVIQSLGFVKNDSTYDGVSNLNASCHISRGSRANI